MHSNISRLLFFILLIISALHINAQELCNNGMDDDGDGLIDFNDPECNCAGISSFLTSSIIPNPSFETATCCPTVWGDMDCLVTWTQGSTGAALDYINQCGLMASDWLNPPLPFPDGEGCVGFVANLQDVGFQEYVAACLNRPIQADTSYTLNFNLGFGIPANLSPAYNLDTVYSADSVELAIFGNPTCDSDQLPYPGIGCPTNAVGSEWVLINTITVEGRQEWVETAFEFTPSNTYRSIAIGASCGIKDLGAAAEYYFIDNLILSESRNFELDAPIKSGSECDNFLRLESPVVMPDIEYQWYMDGVALPGETSSDLTLTGGNLSGQYQVRLSQGSNCELSKAITLIDNPNLQAELMGDTLVCPGDSTSLRIDEQFMQYEWSTGSTDSILHIGESGGYEITVSDENGCTLVLQKTVIVADSIDPQGVVTHAAGTNDNGSIVLSPRGGFAPYTYSWSTGASSNEVTGLSAGNYQLTIGDDEGCEAVFEFSVLFEPDEFLVSIESEPISCHGFNDGFIRLQPEGGRQPYRADWSDGSVGLNRTELAPGQYEVTVSDSDHEREVLSFNINEPDPLNLSVRVTDPSCKGFSDGAIDLEVSGGRSEYQIWINGSAQSHSAASNLSAGTYTIEVTDQSNCQIFEEVVLDEPDILDVRHEAQAPNCFGYETGWIEILDITGGTAPYSARLNDNPIDVSGARQLSSGSFLLQVLDQNSCLWMKEVVLPEPEQIEVRVSASNEQVGRGQELTLEAQAFPSDVNSSQRSWVSDTFDPQLECISCLKTTARPMETTIFGFQLWVDDCLYTDEVEIEVKDRDLFIPNIFTPNGDGNNDRFTFFGNPENDLLIKELNIFNRYGQTVFQVRNLPHSNFNGWSGQFRGEDAPEGVYIYTMVLEDGRGEVERLSGDVSLVR
ncbi:MAG: T9SS type B sorting domain-containing protein [Bacteroidetes bacterium]|jgi:gliding motility-associated-like protein|nr:T9SS type B sorting domain-containing protein [Bacteroidota bacterium]